MDTADKAMLAESVAGRIQSDATAAANDAALAELGWADMLAAEPIGSTGVVFEQLGSAAAVSNALDDVVATAVGLPVGTAIVHPAWGTLHPAPTDVDGTIGNRAQEAELAHRLTVDGLQEVDTASLETEPGHPDVSFTRVRFEGVTGDHRARSTEEIAAAVTAARRALAHQLHGIAAGMLDLARRHALERIQFGRPIASFQAVRHKLAETLVAVDAAGDALAAADGSPLAVDLARVLAGRAAQDAARHTQQVLAGIGFTREHPFHRYLFAAVELDGLYGTTDALTRELGRHLLTTREVPRVVEL